MIFIAINSILSLSHLKICINCSLVYFQYVFSKYSHDVCQHVKNKIYKWALRSNVENFIIHLDKSIDFVAGLTFNKTK